MGLGPIGYVGGIWLLWCSDLVSMDILSTTEQEIHTIVQVRSLSQSWLLSSIYGSLRFRERCILWSNLKILSKRHNLPWAVMADFNDVVSGEEKIWGGGGYGIFRRRVLEYSNYMDYCNLFDLGFTGPKFTWTNKRDFPGLIEGRLDRVWATLDQKACFPEAIVKHLARINSDHCHYFYPWIIHLVFQVKVLSTFN